MAAEENRFAVQERILRNKTWQDFSEIWWLFLIKQLFHSRLLDYSQLGATRLVGYLSSHIQRALVE